MDNNGQGRRILLVTFPGQGHINPSLQFTKRLARSGVEVTFLTAFTALNQMSRPCPPIQGLTFVGFSAGYDDGPKPGMDFEQFLSQLRSRGSDKVSELLSAASDDGQPFSRVVYSILLPWAATVARDLHVPSTLLWIQPAALLDIYYYYFNGYGEEIQSHGGDSSWSIQLPGLPRLTSRDLPSFFVMKSVYNFAMPLFEEHLQILESEESTPKVLVNTFEGLEPEALQAIEWLNLVPVGPLIPTAFLDGHDPSDNSFGGDILNEKSKDYIEWLDSNPKGSVVYASFGSYSVISRPQVEEIAKGLLDSRRPFLWVIRLGQNDGDKEEGGWLSCAEELGKHGKIVPWCSQIEVLSHPSLGCFLTHCGWNSSLESLAFGVPVVGFPQWTDQATNMKLIEDVWRTGVRVERGEDGIVKGEEFERCIDMVMEGGERGEEMRRNANKWKDLAREAGKKGGSSDLNVEAFLDDI